MQVLAIYKYASLWTKNETESILRLLHRWMPMLFPIELPLSPGKQAIIRGPEDFRRDELPSYLVSGDSPVFFSFFNRNGTLIEISETTEIGLRPGSAVITLSGGDDPRTSWQMWPVIASANEIDAETAVLADKPLLRDMYKAGLVYDAALVPLGICCVNYWCSAWVDRVGRRHIETIRKRTVRCEELDDGSLVFALHDQPCDSANPLWNRQRLDLEEEIGLDALRQRHRV